MYIIIYTLRSDEFQTRWSAVKKEIKGTGTYELTHEELEYGVQLCWRNEPRCSARIQWKNLVSNDFYIKLTIFLGCSLQYYNLICNNQCTNFRPFLIKEMLQLPTA